MKTLKTFFAVLILVLTTAISAFPQRIAVLEFTAGVGVSTADVDGLSSIFTTYFAPKGYTLVERSEIDKVIDEQKFQRSSLTESQMVRLGKILNLSKVVFGKINVVMGEYNVDVRAINVESGTIAATYGASFAQGSYRESMKKVALGLANELSPTVTVVTNQNGLPDSIIRKLSRKPQELTVAIWLNGQTLYFADKETIKEIIDLPYKPNGMSIMCVMIKGGEDAFGVLPSNILGKVDELRVSKYFETKRPYILPSYEQIREIYFKKQKVNELLDIIGGESMNSDYWTGDVSERYFEYDRRHKLSRCYYKLDSDQARFAAKQESDLKAFVRPIYTIHALRTVFNM